MNKTKTLTIPKLIGDDPAATSDLVGNRIQRAIEDLAACAVICRDQGLAREYRLLREMPPDRRMKILRHPLFGATVSALNRGTMSNAAITAEATRSLAVLRTDVGVARNENGGEWLKLDKYGRLSLPFTNIVIDCGQAAAHEEIRVEPATSTIHVTCYNETFEVSRQTLDFLTVHKSSDGSLIRIWKTPGSSLLVNCLTSVFRDGIATGWRTSSLSPRLSRRWSDVLDCATEILISCAADHWADVQQLVQIIVPVHQFDTDAHLSCSTPEIPGVVYMSWTPDVIQILEALVHEAAHHKLFLYELSEDLVVSSRPDLLHSPWRKDLRPPRGVVHGAYVFCGVLSLWQTLLSAQQVPEVDRDRLVRLSDRVAAQVRKATLVVREHVRLSPLGEDVLLAIEKRLGEYEANSDSPAKLQPIEGEPVQPRDAAITISGLRAVEQQLLNKAFALDSRAEDLAEQTSKLIQSTLVDFARPSWLQSITERSISVHFLHWCLPLAEAAELDFRSPFAANAMRAHSELGLIWRYSDLTLDGECASHEEVLDCEDAAFSLFPLAMQHVKEIDGKWTRWTTRFLLYFRRYHARHESTGAVDHDSIWRRCTPYFVLPKLLLRRQRNLVHTYKQYMNFVGVLHDLEDLWDDLTNSKVTWCGRTLTKGNGKSSGESMIRDVSTTYAHQLKANIPNRCSIWRMLIADAEARIQALLPEVASSLASIGQRQDADELKSYTSRPF